MPPKKPTTKAKAPAKAPAKKPVAKAATKKSAPLKTVSAKAAAPVKPAPKATAKSTTPSLWQPTAVPLPKEAATPTAPTPQGGYHLPFGHLMRFTFAYFWRSSFISLCYSVIAGVAMGFAYMFMLNSNLFLLGAYITMVILGGLLMGMYTFHWFTHAPSLMKTFRLRLTPSATPRRQIFGLWFSYTWRALLFMVPLVFVTETAMRLLASYLALKHGIFVDNLLSFAIGWMVVNYLLIPFVVAAIVWRWLLKKRTFRWGRLELTGLKD